jgi:hypothetical protein
MIDRILEGFLCRELARLPRAFLLAGVSELRM